MSHQCNNFHCLASLARGAGTFPSLLPHSRCRKSFEIFSSFDYYFTFFTNFINQKLVIMTTEANPSQLKDFSDGDAKVLKFKNSEVSSRVCDVFLIINFQKMRRRHTLVIVDVLLGQEEESPVIVT